MAETSSTSANKEEKVNKKIRTFPSYSFLERTSGAIYAGVPTVDLGCECNKPDCRRNKTL